jgi:hypothetical protein
MIEVLLAVATLAAGAAVISAVIAIEHRWLD